MKTNLNIVLKSVVIAVTVMFTASANAQIQRAKLHDQAVVGKTVGDSLQGASGCTHLKVHVNDQDLIDRVDCYNHSGVYVKVEGAYSIMDLSSTDKGKSNTHSVGCELSLGYDWCKRHWPIAIAIEAMGGGYSNTTIEGRNTKAFVAGIKAPITVFPHSRVSGQIVAGLRYRNVTSSTDINTEYLEGDVSGNWNAFGFSIEGNVLITLFYLNNKNKTMDVAGQKVTAVKHRPVRLVLGAGYEKSNVNKPIINGVSNTLSIGEFLVKAGFMITI